jgi:hypothetical protein
MLTDYRPWRGGSPSGTTWPASTPSPTPTSSSAPRRGRSGASPGAWGPSSPWSGSSSSTRGWTTSRTSPSPSATGRCGGSSGGATPRRRWPTSWASSGWPRGGSEGFSSRGFAFSPSGFMGRKGFTGPGPFGSGSWGLERREPSGGRRGARPQLPLSSLLRASTTTSRGMSPCPIP